MEMNFRISQTAACEMFYSLILMCLLSVIQSHVVPCLSNGICDPDFLCCETFGKQWCCSRGQKCCSDEDGCCPVLLPEVTFHSNEKTKTYQDIVMSSYKNRQYKSLQICDKEGKFSCDKKETCCKVGKFWKCCPYTNGTCCGNRCFPSEKTCDSINHSNRKTMEKLPKTILQEKVSNKGKVYQSILCPDDITVCLDTNTCCLVTNWTYGCCPYEDAVCCSDFTNCCPPNTVCNTEMETCDPYDQNLPRKTFPPLSKIVSWLLLAGKNSTIKRTNKQSVET